MNKVWIVQGVSLLASTALRDEPSEIIYNAMAFRDESKALEYH